MKPYNRFTAVEVYLPEKGWVPATVWSYDYSNKEYIVKVPGKGKIRVPKENVTYSM